VDAVGDLPVYTPMAAVLGQLPPLAEDEQWAYEMKWDGVRALGYVSGGRLRLVSRNAKDVTVAYPELGGLARQLGGRDGVLDGEIVAFDEGRPSFRALQNRMHQRNPAKIDRLMQTVPVTYLLFDMLHLDDQALIDFSYLQRRELLGDLGLSGPRWDTPAYFVGGGADAVAQSQALGLEGVLAKRVDSPYRPGRRVGFWVKVKNIRTQEVVICGWKPGEGRRADMIGSLVLGINDDNGLQFAGGVGTGFTEPMLRELAEMLHPLERPTHPYAQDPPRAETRDTRWVQPRLVGEVAYSERTAGHHLRHPSWRGLRYDKQPHEVVWET
jgi:bifunctional non-homologous end joining protein LigD